MPVQISYRVRQVLLLPAIVFMMADYASAQDAAPIWEGRVSVRAPEPLLLPSPYAGKVRFAAERGAVYEPSSRSARTASEISTEDFHGVIAVVNDTSLYDAYVAVVNRVEEIDLELYRLGFDPINSSFSQDELRSEPERQLADTMQSFADFGYFSDQTAESAARYLEGSVMPADLQSVLEQMQESFRWVESHQRLVIESIHDAAVERGREEKMPRKELHRRLVAVNRSLPEVLLPNSRSLLSEGKIVLRPADIEDAIYYWTALSGGQLLNEDDRHILEALNGNNDQDLTFDGYAKMVSQIIADLTSAKFEWDRYAEVKRQVLAADFTSIDQNPSELANISSRLGELNADEAVKAQYIQEVSNNALRSRDDDSDTPADLRWAADQLFPIVFSFNGNLVGVRGERPADTWKIGNNALPISTAWIVGQEGFLQSTAFGRAALAAAALSPTFEFLNRYGSLADERRTHMILQEAALSLKIDNYNAGVDLLEQRQQLLEQAVAMRPSHGVFGFSGFQVQPSRPVVLISMLKTVNEYVRVGEPIAVVAESAQMMLEAESKRIGRLREGMMYVAEFNCGERISLLEPTLVRVNEDGADTIQAVTSLQEAIRNKMLVRVSVDHVRKLMVLEGYGPPEAQITELEGPLARASALGTFKVEMRAGGSVARFETGVFSPGDTCNARLWSIEG